MLGVVACAPVENTVHHMSSPAINYDLRIPWGYGTATITIREAERTMAPLYHREYLTRQFA